MIQATVLFDSILSSTFSSLPLTPLSTSSIIPSISAECVGSKVEDGVEIADDELAGVHAVPDPAAAADTYTNAESVIIAFDIKQSPRPLL
jgi:hypothetical protein